MAFRLYSMGSTYEDMVNHVHRRLRLIDDRTGSIPRVHEYDDADYVYVAYELHRH